MSEQRLINANALEQNLISKGFYPAMVKRAIEIAPTIEAEPVRHGKWYWADDGYCRCSECHQKCASFDHEEALEARMTNFCPHCGARMDGE